MTEFRADGTPIFHAYLDSGFLDVGVEAYRGFRYNWTGFPNETPAIVALENNAGTTIYVSWNGDTETKTWRFYSITDNFRSRQFLGESKRTGFETSLAVKGKRLSTVLAEALDASGKVLTTSEIASVKQETLPVQKELAKESIDAGCSVSSRWAKYMILKVQRMGF